MRTGCRSACLARLYAIVPRLQALLVVSDQTMSAPRRLQARCPHALDCLGLLASLTFALCVGRPSLAQARPVPVYEVDVAGQSPAALQDAMREALVRTTGHREAATDEALAGIVADAPKYVKDYTKGPAGETQVIFDGTAVERALALAGRGVWSADRPFTLVTLYPPLNNRQLEDSARTELEQEAEHRGLGISLLPIDVADASGAPLGKDVLLQTAQRYGADELLVGRSDGAPAGQWRWTLYTNFSSPSWTGPLAAGIDGTVDTLAPPLGASPAEADADTRIEVDGIGGLTDYASVERLLESLPGVRHTSVAEAQGTQVTFLLTVRGGADALDRVLAGSPRLSRSAGANGSMVYEYHP